MFIYDEKDVFNYKDVDELLALIETDPLEKELLRTSLKERVESKGREVIKYRDDLIEEWISYYERELDELMIFEVVGINYDLVYDLCYAFGHNFIKSFSDWSIYDKATYTTAKESILVIMKHRDLLDVDKIKKIYARILYGQKKRKMIYKITPNLILEILGIQKKDDATRDVYCAIYDRRYNMRGIVAFNI
jgi:mRNA-degrading endonuclease HigB of HigAB toxin-antitoxin module